MSRLVMTRPVVGTLSGDTSRIRARATDTDRRTDLHDLLVAVTADLAADTVATLPIVLCVPDFVDRQARTFIDRCQDTTHRLRPSASLALEASRLVAPFAATGWTGPCHATTTPTGALTQALRSAEAALRTGATAVAVCEVTTTIDDQEYATAACLFRLADPESAPHAVPVDADTATTSLAALWPTTSGEPA
jgi:hypothetical protein